ncbi:MAG: tRNA 2-selenouridine(34) synthase MnmH [Bacteroidetes bacterium]|nr:tRNA 2-selenouridine(34) synthase MnmH [Bacteroidota bacterium]
MPRICTPHEFVEHSTRIPVVDVRSQGEFAHGHLPGAVNIPLLNDWERKEVGTLYKQEGRVMAVNRGLELVGPKMAQMASLARQLAGAEGQLAVYCWRGGMRSHSMAWLFETVGVQVVVLQGGYKAYRRLVQAYFHTPLPLVVLGGYTGSSKTEILRILAALGAQVIDLEALAQHKGSAFGALGQGTQPSVEMFENLLFHAIKQLDLTKPIWIEDESRNIGRVFLPNAFNDQRREARAFFLDRCLEHRTAHLMQHYGQYPAASLAESIGKIKKRLGPDAHKRCLEALGRQDLRQVCQLVLAYYDRAYLAAFNTRPPHMVTHLAYGPDANDETIAKELIDMI